MLIFVKIGQNSKSEGLQVRTEQDGVLRNTYRQKQYNIILGHNIT
jgi:hypothetical protein